jgi:hypothetical protein
MSNPRPRLCAGGVTLRDQVNKKWVSRDKSSDGWIGDSAHAANVGWGTNGRGSYHNPDPNGIVHAIDLDEDFLGKGKGQKIAKEFAEQLATYCRERKDGGRIAHIVYEGQVASATANNWYFRGSGFGHFQHIHISFTNKADRDGSPFNLPIFGSDELWDGKVPEFSNVMAAMNDPSLKNLASYRLACRLHDLGFFKGEPVKYEQGYPWKSVAAWQKSKGYNVQPPGTYGRIAHRKIFGE